MKDHKKVIEGAYLPNSEVVSGVKSALLAKACQGIKSDGVDTCNVNHSKQTDNSQRKHQIKNTNKLC